MICGMRNRKRKSPRKRVEGYKPRIRDGIARAMLNLFHVAYRHGIEDAADISDPIQCSDYVEAMTSAHTFRLLKDDYDISWKEWRMMLCVMSRKLYSYRSIAHTFLMSIDKYGVYYAVPLRIAMDWYVKGVEHFTKYPEHRNLEIFLTQGQWYIWRRGWESEPKRQIKHFIDEMQLLTFNRSRLDRKIVEDDGPGANIAMTERTYMTFVEAMWRNYANKDFYENIEY